MIATLRPKAGQNARQFLINLRGLYVLLHVRTEGKQTSVIVNIESRTTASWRWIDRKNKGAAALNLEWPGFDLTENTVVISDSLLNELAAADPEVFKICAGGGDGSTEFHLDAVPLSPTHMDELLKRLEANSAVLQKRLQPKAPRVAK